MIAKPRRPIFAATSCAALRWESPFPHSPAIGLTSWRSHGRLCGLGAHTTFWEDECGASLAAKSTDFSRLQKHAGSTSQTLNAIRRYGHREGETDRGRARFAAEIEAESRSVWLRLSVHQPPRAICFAAIHTVAQPFESVGSRWRADIKIVLQSPITRPSDVVLGGRPAA